MRSCSRRESSLLSRPFYLLPRAVILVDSGYSWYFTDDDRLAITGGVQCLDEGDNGVQTYSCETGNGNQGECGARLSFPNFYLFSVPYEIPNPAL